MEYRESAGAFMERAGKKYAEAGQFNVYRVDGGHPVAPSPFIRRDYYKISLICDTDGWLHYADKKVFIKDRGLVFGNPMVPYAWEGTSAQQGGYYCLFTEDFVHPGLRADSLSASPLFRVGGQSVLVPDDALMALLISIFERMMAEINSTYEGKYDLLRSYTQIILHEALKMQPREDSFQPGGNATRITDLFLELLERQFPITEPRQTVQLKNANEFARQLSVHTNHLNKSLRDITGKTTSEHINERFTREAKALLQHTSWQVAEIGYCLGYEHDSNFNIFFKKQTGQTPKQFRFAKS